MEINNRTVRIIQVPKANPSREMWMMSEENFDLRLKENEFIVKNEFILLDDRTLDYLNKESSKILDKVMFAITFGKVLESRNVNYVKNDIVIGNGGVQDYCITDEKIFNKVDNDSYFLDENEFHEGIHNFHNILMKLYDDEKKGKLVLKI
jgi:NADPH-dependent curcumin reductase CurA